MLNQYLKRKQSRNIFSILLSSEDEKLLVNWLGKKTFFSSLQVISVYPYWKKKVVLLKN